MIRIVFGLLFILSTVAFKEQDFTHILNGYQRRTVRMDVIKTSYNKVIHTKSSSSGQFSYSKGFWRWDIRSPKKSSILYDGKQVRLQVSGSKRIHNLPISKALPSNIVALLFDSRRFMEHFKYVKTTQKGRTKLFEFTSVKMGIDLLSIKIEKKRILALSLLWSKSRGEEYYEFRNIHFNKKFKKNWLKF